MERCAQFAHMAYMWLPFFLGSIAGVCLLILSIRRSETTLPGGEVRRAPGLTAGVAASLAALAGVVVFGIAFLAGEPHGFSTRAAGQTTSGGARVEDLRRELGEVHEQVERLSGELRKLREARATGTVGALPRTSPPPAPPAPPAGGPGAVPESGEPIRTVPPGGELPRSPGAPPPAPPPPPPPGEAPPAPPSEHPKTIEDDGGPR